MSDRTCSAPGCTRPLSSKGYCKRHAERVRRHGTPDGFTPRTSRSLAARLAEKVDASGGPDACWPFTGVITSTGYGRIRTGSTGTPTIGAHRAALLVANPGDEPPEVIDHRCHDPKRCDLGNSCPHRRCCNPAHLAPSTVRENSAADRQWTRAQLTHCRHGHEFSEPNTYRDAQGARHCRACGRVNARRYRTEEAS